MADIITKDVLTLDEIKTVIGQEKKAMVIYDVSTGAPNGLDVEVLIGMDASIQIMNAQTFTAAILTNPYTASKTPRRIGDYALNTTTGEIWQSTSVVNAAASWNRISAGFYNGSLITDWNTHNLSGDLTSYGTATGAPTTAESFWGHHINSNAGTVSAYQIAIGYTTGKIYHRSKSASTWGAWSVGVTATELGYLSGVTSNIQTQLNTLSTELNGYYNYKSGYYLNGDGNEVADNNYCYSDYVALSAENVAHGIDVYFGTQKTEAKIVIYNSAKQIVDNFSILNDVGIRRLTSSQLTNNAAFVRFSFSNDYDAKIEDVSSRDTLYQKMFTKGALFLNDIVDNLSDGGSDKVLSAEQGKVLGSKLSEIVKDVANYKSGYYLNADGDEVADVNYCYSDFIPIDYENLQGEIEWYYGTYKVNARLIIYDSDKNVLDNYGMIDNSDARMLPKSQLGASCAYIRISFSADYVGKVRDTATVNYIYSAHSYTDYTIEGLKQAVSLTGSSMAIKTAESLTSGNAAEITDFPQALQKNGQISFNAKLLSFGNGFTLGRGTTEYGADKIKIDDTNIEISNLKGGTWVVYARAPHGLTFNTFVKVIVSQRRENLFVVIVTLNGIYQHEFVDVKYNHNGNTRVQSDGASFTDVVLTAANPDLKCPMWMFGDSYFGADTTNREMYYLIREWGYSNFLLCGFPGADSSEIFPDVERCLKYGTPKYIVWCLGMNDGTTATMYNNYLNKLESICGEKGIELILQTIPTVPNLNKSAINSVIVESGHRYIDAYSAVGANNDGEWYNYGEENDYLSSDKVHPSEYGARALAAQFLIDVPEVMEY